jgi:cation diffusion facilitator CzcD-associated flavoprotein CzcO
MDMTFACCIVGRGQTREKRAMADGSAFTPPGAAVDVAVLGAGFSGLGMAYHLKKEAKRSFLVLEKAQDVGGTWRENSYPGCACDVASPLYSFSFAQNPNWSRMFSTQPEIWAYLRDFAVQNDLGAHIRFGAEVAGAQWDDTAGLWRIALRTGEIVSARVIASGMGGLHIPAFPEVQGVGRFAGPAFHSAQWRHDVDLTGKSVAVIGTGASAIQFVPQIQPTAAKIHLYQRTAPWILPKLDRPFAAWEKRLFAAAPVTQEALRRWVYLTNEIKAFAFIQQNPKLIEKTQHMALEHLNAQIADPALRKRLTPDYAIGCKRVLISNDYYPAVAQPNVEIVTDPIREITADGVTTIDGTARKADVLIYGTGFQPMNVEIDFVGRDGRSLAQDAWKDRPRAHLGLTVAGFPNLFFLMGPNTGLGHNSMVYMIESQIAFVIDALTQMDARGARAIEVKGEAEAAFNTELQEKLSRTIWASGCRSWYVKVDGGNATTWPSFTFQYRKRTKAVPVSLYGFA